MAKSAIAATHASSWNHAAGSTRKICGWAGMVPAARSRHSVARTSGRNAAISSAVYPWSTASRNRAAWLVPRTLSSKWIRAFDPFLSPTSTYHRAVASTRSTTAAIWSTLWRRRCAWSTRGAVRFRARAALALQWLCAAAARSSVWYRTQPPPCRKTSKRCRGSTVATWASSTAGRHPGRWANATEMELPRDTATWAQPAGTNSICPASRTTPSRDGSSARASCARTSVALHQMGSRSW